MKKTTVIRIALVAVFLLLVLVLAGLALKGGPQRQAHVTATLTRTARPTFTATALPSLTPVPSATPPPTHTPTATAMATAVPTDTPAPTLTATPPQAPTPVPPPPTATATRKPPAAPTQKPTPKPSNTPAPPFSGKIVRGYARCDGFAAVTGNVQHANKSPYPLVSVGVWSDLWDGQVDQTEDSGKFDVALNSLPPGTFHVAVVDAASCSRQADQYTARNCKRLSNVLEVTTTAACSGSGANQVTEVLFTGP